MRNVKMDKIGLLAAAMYEILENRRYKKTVVRFSVLIELVSTVVNDQVMFGNMITGHIQTDKISDRESDIEFVIHLTDTDLKIEIPKKTVLYPLDTPQSIAYIDVTEPIEINFEKRSITYKRVHDFNMKNVSWDWQSVKGTALDVIGVILGDKNS